MRDKDKKQKTVSFNNIVLQFIIIAFFTIIWLNAPLFGIGALNIAYFLFMFLGIIVSSLFTLYSKANPDMPIPKKPSQQFSNLVKAMIDIIVNHIIKITPAVEEMQSIIGRALIWSLREAKISPEFDREILLEAEQYVFDKLYPNEKSDESSQPNGENVSAK